MTKLLRLFRSERAATAIEYGMIAALIAVSALVAIQSFANEGVGKWNTVGNAATNATPS